MLTVEAYIMVGEDGRAVPLGRAPDHHVQEAVRRLDVMFLQGRDVLSADRTDQAGRSCPRAVHTGTGQAGPPVQDSLVPLAGQQQVQLPQSETSLGAQPKLLLLPCCDPSLPTANPDAFCLLQVLHVFGVQLSIAAPPGGPDSGPGTLQLTRHRARDSGN